MTGFIKPKKFAGRLIGEAAYWTIAALICLPFLIVLMRLHHVQATTGGTMKLYFHKENSDANTTYNSAALTPPEPGALNPVTTTASTTTFTAPPCEASTLTSENINNVGLDAGTAGDRCVGTFISSPVGQSLTISTTDTNALSVTWWDGSPSVQNGFTYTGNFRFYRLSGTTYTLFATLTSATITVSTGAVGSHSITGTPTTAVTLASGDRIAIVESMNLTVDQAGVTLDEFFDHSTDVASATLSYTVITPSKPTLAGAQDDDFTTAAATTSCTNAGATYNTKWTCTTPTGTALGNFNAASDSSQWLWLQNIQGATLGTNFGTSPTNTYIYQTVPTGDGDIITVANSSLTFNVGASSATTPFFHCGLLYWTSNTDYIIVEVLQSAAGTRGVAVNQSGTLSATTATASNFNELWLKINKTGTSYQPYYSTDGTTFNALGSAIVHATAFTRMGLTCYAGLASSRYAGAFEYFKSTLATAVTTPTTDQLLRHGDWWNSGAKQSFFWAK